jgi:hypothetical protein
MFKVIAVAFSYLIKLIESVDAIVNLYLYLDENCYEKNPGF